MSDSIEEYGKTFHASGGNCWGHSSLQVKFLSNYIQQSCRLNNLLRCTRVENRCNSMVVASRYSTRENMMNISYNR